MMTVRPYSDTDKPQVVALIKHNIPNYFHESEEKDFIDYLDNEKEDYFVVEENKEVIGCGGINYFPAENAARLSWDMIHPNYQGKGIGRELVLHRLNYIRKNSSATSVVVRTSQLVYKFYQKFGFKIEKIEKDFWAQGFHLYQLKYNF